MLEESISAYKDDAGGCSEPFPAHVALRAYFTALHHSSQPSVRKQPSFFPNVAARAEQKLAI